MGFTRSYVYYPYGRGWAKILGGAGGSLPAHSCPAKLSTSVGTFVISISPAPGPNRSHYRSGALPTLRDPAGAAYACGPGVPMTIAYFSRSFLYVASTIPLWRASIHSRCTASRTFASGLEPPSICSLT